MEYPQFYLLQLTQPIFTTTKYTTKFYADTRRKDKSVCTDEPFYKEFISFLDSSIKISRQRRSNLGKVNSSPNNRKMV